MRKLNKNNGITLIALVITIIVMLILVSVSISMAVNGGLFNYAGKAVGDTKNAIDKEKELSKGRIKIGDTWYDSIDDYLKNKPSANQDSNDGGLKITSQVISNGKDVDIDLTFSINDEYMYNYIDKNFYTDKEETELEKMLENLTAGTDNEITFTDELRAAVKAEVESVGISYKAYLKLYLVELGEDTQKIQQIQDAMKISVTVSNGDTFEVSIGGKYSYLVLESGIYTFEAVTGEGIKATHTVEVKGDFETFSAPYTTTEKNNYKDEEGNKATIPAGFSVGTSDTISKISTGLVIRDANGNEFVWIPVTEDLANPYNAKTNYSEPTVLTYTYSSSGAPYDSQKTLDYLYGENYYNYAEDFNYADEYEKMVDRVNFYGGFYIGRYETTIDERGNIGSKNNTEVLTAGTTLFTKTNEEGETVNYPYMWYGLYYAQKNANVTGNKEDVQTAMIYGQLWDKAMEYIRTQKTAGKTKYNVDSATDGWHNINGVVNSGQANKTTVGVNGASGDVALNIWDLEANADEWTQESCNALGRSLRGGDINVRFCASERGHYMRMNGASTTVSSRLTLYIK